MIGLVLLVWLAIVLAAGFWVLGIDPRCRCPLVPASGYDVQTREWSPDCRKHRSFPHCLPDLRHVHGA